MEEMSIDIHIKPSVQRYIVEKAYDPKFGARPLRRRIQTDLEDQLSDAILKGEIKGNSNITCNVADDKIVFETPKTKNGRKTRGGKKK
jgi:ATP-dependent Clp protease ATP-binding subunit ClpC